MARSRTTEISQGLVRDFSRLLAVCLFQIRCRGREHLPPVGGGLLVSNHQSHLDPWIVGLCSDRLLCYVARGSLFRFAPFRAMIAWFGAIPIDREGTGLSGLKETLKRLKQGEVVLVFPEGTRSPDGQMRTLKPGFLSIAKRSGLPLVPMAIDGTFDAFPRHQRLPRPAAVHVEFGPPLMATEIGALGDDELLAEVERRIRECHARAREGRQRAGAAKGGGHRDSP